MKLLLRREQRGGLMGKVVFTLEVRADISAAERDHIKKYKLGETELYKNYETLDRGSGLLGLASRVAFKAMTITITVNDLTNGRRVDCKDIVEMLAVEDQIREAAATFAQVLRAAAQFGGEEVVEL